MTDLQKEIYIQFLELYAKDLETELFLAGIREKMDKAILDHFQREKDKQPDQIKPLNPYHWERSCQACGLRLDGPMGYVCPNARCPAGLGNVFVD